MFNSCVTLQLRYHFKAGVAKVAPSYRYLDFLALNIFPSIESWTHPQIYTCQEGICAYPVYYCAFYVHVCEAQPLYVDIS